MRAGIRAVLFDLDGTLIDSAPDMAAAANAMRAQRGLAPRSYDALRQHVGSGARGMLRGAFDMQPGDPDFDAMRTEFLDAYEARMLLLTAPFAAVPCVLDRLDAQGLCWGIVTNKALRFAEPLTRALGLWPRAGALIGGNSTPHTKPHPAPLLEAARRLQIEPSACVYVGDDARDVQAGRAAGMATLAAAWGYLGPDADVTLWAADDVAATPEEVLHWLELA